MSYQYDDQNIFAKIVRGEIPCEKVLDTGHTLAFRDIDAKAEVHVLVIPKGAYVNADHFAAEASDEEIVDFTRAVSRVVRETGIAEAAGGSGFRAIANAGPHGGQEVPHYHLHVVGGEPLGPFLPRRGQG